MAKKYLRECTSCGDLIYTKVRDSVPICNFCKEKPEKKDFSHPSYCKTCKDYTKKEDSFDWYCTKCLKNEYENINKKM
jgi:hypothetical protein